MENNLIKSEVESRIFTIRGMQVMIDRDLADFFQTTTKRINEQVKRNTIRFPDSYYFQVDKNEKEELVANCDRLKSMRHSTSFPFAFTEYGIAMVATILRTEIAAKMSIHIINSFILFRNNVNLGQLLYLRVNSIESRVIEEGEIRILKNSHDRFLILDEKELYHLGASLKDLGKRWFAFSKLDGLVCEILKHLV